MVSRDKWASLLLTVGIGMLLSAGDLPDDEQRFEYVGPCPDDPQRIYLQFNPPRPGKYVARVIDLTHSTPESLVILFESEVLSTCECCDEWIRFCAAVDTTQGLHMFRVDECDEGDGQP